MPRTNLSIARDHPERNFAATDGAERKGEAADAPQTPASPQVQTVDESDSPWAPLTVPIFRAFWIASLVSNLGTWVHEVGAGWLMTSLDPNPEMVSAVRVAISFPTLLLAIPAGVLADRFDRRKLLIFTQLLLFSTTATLARLWWRRRMGR